MPNTNTHPFRPKKLICWIYVVWDEKSIKKKLNFCDPLNRDEILDYMLWKNPTVLTFEQKINALGFFYQYQMIVYYDSEATNNEIDEMCTTLQQITSENAQIIRELHNFSMFVMNADQRLLLKYLFRIKIRKSYSFLRLIINAALCQATQQPSELTDYLFYTTIIHTMHFWSKRHFIFAIKHGICKIIVSNIISRSNQNNAEANLMEINLQYFGFFIAYINKYNLSEYYLSELAKECFSNNEHEMKVLIFLKAKEFLQNISMDIKFSEPNDIIPKIPLKCQWITCNKKEDQNKLYRCKGCKLIVYCCRNHQKKHWNSFHSRQCLRQQ
eukprot:456067_1